MMGVYYGTSWIYQIMNKDLFIINGVDVDTDCLAVIMKKWAK